MTLLLIALVAVVLDVVWTIMIRAIQHGRAWVAAVTQGLFTALAVGATWFVVESASVPALAAYSVGSALGTGLVVRYTRGSRV